MHKKANTRIVLTIPKCSNGHEDQRVYMHTKFGGHGFSGFGNIATFKNGQISLSDHGL